MTESEIVIRVQLDQNRTPEKILWRADENPNPNDLQNCNAMLLSLFEERSEETLKLDLWTKEMKIEDMDRLVYHSIRGMADSYFKATKNNALATAMQQFATYFGQETGIVPKEDGADQN